MRIPDCPDHGRLVLDLAQGRLDDRESAEAESVRTSCPVCAGWWQTELEGDLAAGFDDTVATAIAGFQPARRRVPVWLPAAAAATLVVGAAALWYGGDRLAFEETSQGALVQESFDSDINGDGTIDASDLGLTVHIEGRPSAAAPGATAGDVIFADSLDSGDLAGWTSNT